MKRLFLILGIVLFAGGSFVLSQNYTIVHLDEAQLAQLQSGATTLQSSALNSQGEMVIIESPVVLRFGSFALAHR